MYTIKGLGPEVAMALMSKDYVRFLIGKCRNPNCDCEEILIFWRHNEDKEIIDRLTKMGIKI